jgi:hypothetical protein
VEGADLYMLTLTHLRFRARTAVYAEHAITDLRDGEAIAFGIRFDHRVQTFDAASFEPDVACGKLADAQD